MLPLIFLIRLRNYDLTPDLPLRSCNFLQNVADFDIILAHTILSTEYHVDGTISIRGLASDLDAYKGP
jgi:hypothetical protein